MRLFQFINIFTKTESSKLINLTHVSQFVAKKKELQLIMNHEIDTFFGSGGNTKISIYYDKPEEMQADFNDIQLQLREYYTNKQNK